jgi:uncharacterized membrane protein YedE/YeeE
MSAIEDALVGGDYRGAKAWGLAIAVGGLTTMALTAAGLVSLGSSSSYNPLVNLLGTIAGGLVFGLGMTLVGTCSFGLVVRSGGGDLRAVVAAVVVGIFAFAATSGVLAPLREFLVGIGVVDLSWAGAPTFDRMLATVIGLEGGRLVAGAALAGLAVLALADGRVRRRPRLMLAAVLVGLAVAAGWLTTSFAVDEMTATRVESLSFVAPAGRLLLQFMTMSLRDAGFGMAALLGAGLASFAVAAAKRELRWEAFDDAREMRRHLAGAALMGVGGVLAHGCTVGQGLTAASALAVTAPVFIASVLIGAQAGLKFLIEGVSLWRLGFSPRAD